ncbi:MAG: efflux RND transporter periplasmic adaptor subunit [Desulfobulbaceae bacterium]|nr:efflux RND transporter periplasmic adaptor subunit [Desulfobulbaceae bacterium]
MFFKRILPICLFFIALAAPLWGAEYSVRALLVPVEEATISSRIDGLIVSLPVEEGDRFQNGDLLVEFDCAILKAELQKAHIDLEAAVETHEAQLQLQKYGSGSDVDVALASAKRKRASAEVLVTETKVGMCIIKAPFSGRVVKRKANPYETVSAEVPILEILNDTNLKLHLLVPSHWLTWLKKGHELMLRVDETGTEYPARVLALGAKVNPVNQTLEVSAAVEGSHAELLAGMSGTAVFSPPGKGKH